MALRSTPGSHSDVDEYVSTEAANDPIRQGQFTVVNGTSVSRAAAADTGRVVGIADQDQVEGKVAVWNGGDVVKSVAASGATFAVNGSVFVASADEITNTGATGQQDIGTVTEILDDGAVRWRPRWFRHVPRANAV